LITEFDEEIYFTGRLFILFIHESVVAYSLGHHVCQERPSWVLLQSCPNRLKIRLDCHKLSSAGRNAFIVAASSVWNSLAELST